MLKTQKVQAGDTLKAGLINGLMGTASVLGVSDNSIELELELVDQPLSPLPLSLILAMPRPKMLKRILQTTATMGVKKIYLINSYRVEKSYWHTPLLNPESIKEQLLLGLEQGVDTILPEVSIHKRFKPFVEDQLPAIIAGCQALVAHPKGVEPCPIAINQPATLAVGPEGGFIDYEITKLVEIGFQAVYLGPRILRVENRHSFVNQSTLHCLEAAKVGYRRLMARQAIAK